MKSSTIKIGFTSSGLGQVWHWIEAWAHTLATILNTRIEKVMLFKGAGLRERSFERVVPCWRHFGTAWEQTYIDGQGWHSCTG